MCGDFIIRYEDGKEVKAHPKSKHTLPSGASITLHEAGGGGYGLASQRNPESVLDDVIKGYVSVESAREDYRVAIDEQHGISTIDWDETKRLRSAS